MRWQIPTLFAVVPSVLVATTLAASPHPAKPTCPGTTPPPVEQQQPPLDDPTIVAIFDAANTADIETGSLAAKRAHSKEVRDYGSMIAHDHAAVRQQGRELAKRLGVTPTPPADDASGKAHAEAMATLRGKHGADFDRAFLQHEVAFHQSVIDAIQTTLLPAIQNEELKALVVKVAPAFQAHLLAAQRLQKQLGQAEAAAK
jgi:putative membrane protein